MGAAVTRFERRNAGPRVTLQPPCPHRVGGGMRRVLGIAVVLVAFAAPAGDCGGQDEQGGQAGGKAGVPRRARHHRRDARGLQGQVGRVRALPASEGARGQGRAQGGPPQRGQGLPRRARHADATRVPRQVRHEREQEERFGKCVSEKAKAKRQEQDQEDAAEADDTKNAAQECDAERSADRKAFEDNTGRITTRRTPLASVSPRSPTRTTGKGTEAPRATVAMSARRVVPLARRLSLTPV